MKFEIRNSFEWTYPDTAPEQSAGEVSLTVLKSSRASFCIFCEDFNASAGLCFTAQTPEHVQACLYRLLPVRVSENTGVHGFTLKGDEDDADIFDAHGKPYYTRIAPFYVYDAMTPANTCNSFNTRECFFAEFVTSAQTQAGEYTVKISLFGQSITVYLTVADLCSPEQTLYITNWHSNAIIAKRYGLEPWSDAHFEMIEQYVRLMRLARQNVAWITYDCVKTDSEGNFDFSNAERLADIYLRNGIKLIEGAPFFGRDEWQSKIFKISTPQGQREAMSDEGYAYACKFISAWMGFIKDAGLKDKLIQHVGDEPHNDCKDEYIALCSLVRMLMPGVPLIEAVETYDLKGGPDIFVPKNDYYERNTAELEKLRECGHTLWFYTCCIPGGFYMNRLLDMPLLKTRYLHWGNYKYNIPGYLHWGFNHLNPEYDTLEYSELEFEPNKPNRLPAGDTHIVYSDGVKPLRSLRLEQMRAGAEEYELFKLLGSKDADKASELLARCFTSFCECNTDADNFNSVRRLLIDAVKGSIG